jgi:hypothetical protein
MTNETEGAAKTAEPKQYPKAAQASISTARQMIANGRTREESAGWLARNVPTVFKSAAEADEAIGPV